MKKIIISEEERNRILGMHVDATKKHYKMVSEQRQATGVVDSEGEPFLWSAIKDNETLEKFKKEANSLDNIDALVGGKVYDGKSYEHPFNLGIDKDNDNYRNNAARNISRGLILAAKLGRKVKSNDLEEMPLAPTSSKFEPGKDHDASQYANIVNIALDKISDKLGLQPKLV